MPPWSRILLILLPISLLLFLSLLAKQGNFQFRHILPKITSGLQSDQSSATTNPVDLTQLIDGDESDRKTVNLVVASQRADDTSWLKGHLHNWKHVIYVTDDDNAQYTVRQNKGRENMVYLRYIIDNYENLPEITIFQHANRYQWHNDDPLYDGLRVLERLQLPYVKQQGYVNLRCVWTLGCPSEIEPFENERSSAAEGDSQNAGAHYRKAFEEMFPGEEVPEHVGVSCCNQFAATAEKIRERPLGDYQRIREWLRSTPLNDDISGRILEYSWHIILRQNAVHCPDAPDCYCKVFGLCHLDCESSETCQSQYSLPIYSNMPDGWPDYDYDGEWRNITELRQQQELDYTPTD